MKRITLIIITMLLSTAAFAQKTYDTDFAQTREMKVSGKTFNKAGHLVFDGNDHLSMTYDDPEGEYFIIDGTKVKINLDGKKADLDSEKVKMVQLQRSTLLNCLIGNWEQAADDNNADIQISEKDGLRNVFIKARGKAAKGGYSSVELTYRTDNDMLTRMVLEEAIGIINTYEIK